MYSDVLTLCKLAGPGNTNIRVMGVMRHPHAYITHIIPQLSGGPEQTMSGEKAGEFLHKDVPQEFVEISLGTGFSSPQDLRRAPQRFQRPSGPELRLH